MLTRVAVLRPSCQTPTTDLRLATSIINELLTDAKAPGAAALWYGGDRFDREHANGAGRRLHPGRGAAWRLVHDCALIVRTADQHGSGNIARKVQASGASPARAIGRAAPGWRPFHSAH